MGDKSRPWVLVLAALVRRPCPIFAGIFFATIVNHTLAGAAGAWLTTVLGPQVLRWILAASFIAMALWIMVPDKLDDGEEAVRPSFGVFGTTVLAFFLAELGDKTQVATVMLAARVAQWWAVVAGTTVGMMIANVPAVWFGERMTRVVPIRVVHAVSALVFVGLGV